MRSTFLPRWKALTDEGSGVEVALDTDLEVDSVTTLLVGSDGTSLGVTVNAVEVTSLVGREGVEGLQGDRVLGRRVSESSGVGLGLLGLGIDGRVNTGKEAVLADNSIGSDGRAVQDVGNQTSVEGRLPVGGGDESSLGALVRVQETEKLELQAYEDVVSTVDVSPR